MSSNATADGGGLASAVPAAAVAACAAIASGWARAAVPVDAPACFTGVFQCREHLLRHLHIVQLSACRLRRVCALLRSRALWVASARLSA